MDQRYLNPRVIPLNRATSPRFIGRTDDIRKIGVWLSKPRSNSRILSISGIGGIGKTTLMTEMANICRHSSAKVIWLDGRTFAKRPFDFLSGLEMSIQHEHGLSKPDGVSTLDHVIDFFHCYRTAVFLDNCDTIDGLDGWLLSSFIPRLPAGNQLLVVAGRTGLPITWRTHPSLHGRLESIELDGFTDTEARDYLRQHDVSDEMAESILAKAHGHPLSLAIAVDALLSSTGSQDILRDIPSLISTEILQEVTSPSLFSALQVLSILSVATPSDLRQLTDENASGGWDTYQELRRLSFIHVLGQELFMHDVVARMLRQDFREREPVRFREACKRAMVHMANQYPNSDTRIQMRIATHFLTLHVEVAPLRYPYADFVNAPTLGLHRDYRPEELPALHRILQVALTHSTWQCELIRPGMHHALLDDLARCCPEGIRVVKSDSGRPLTLGAVIWLRSDTLPLLEKYAPRFLDEVLVDQIETLRTTSQENMDSVCLLLAAVDMEHPVYSPEQLGVISFTDWYQLATSGVRTIVVSGDPYLIHLASQFGYNETGHLLNPLDHRNLSILEWDFRDQQFPVWAQFMISRMDGSGSVSREEPDANSEGSLTLDYDEMKEILKHFHRPDNLELTAFAQHARLSGFQLQQLVQQLLKCDEPMLPMTKQDQTILRATMEQRNVGKDILADTLHVSRTTLYRHSRTATSNLAQALVASLTHLR